MWTIGAGNLSTAFSSNHHLQAMRNQLIEKQFKRNLPVFLLQDQVVQSPSRLLYNYSPTTAVLKVRNNQKAKHEALAEILHLTAVFACHYNVATTSTTAMLIADTLLEDSRLRKVALSLNIERG